MESDLAKHVALTGFRSMRHLTDVLQLLKQHCDPAEYASYREKITRVAGIISVEIINRTLSSHPEVEQDIGNKVEKYGKFI